MSEKKKEGGEHLPWMARSLCIVAVGCRSSSCTLGDVAPANHPCRGLCGHWLARVDGRSAVTQHGEQR